MSERDSKNNILRGSATIEQVRKVIDLIGHGGRGVPIPARAPRPIEDSRTFVLERRLDKLRAARASIPKGFEWARFGDELTLRVKPKSAIMRVRGSEDSMVLFGPSTVGKTSLACALLRELLSDAAAVARMGAWDDAARRRYQAAVDARFSSAYHLAKAQMYSPLGQMPEVIAQALSASVLVIDDLGMDYEVYRSSASAVLEILHERHANLARTIITTNLTPAQIEERYGAGIARRLREWKNIAMGGEA